MATGNSVAPVLIKKKKVVNGGGHHGGAWKVAYADFVTAMMAFFMLMWLLNATTEKQRKGIADYFNPTIPINRISGGGDGAFGGDSIFSETSLARSGTGASGLKKPWQTAAETQSSGGAENAHQEKLLDELNATLIGGGGESDLMENALRHVISRLSDEGVVVELFDLPDSPLFDQAGRANSILNALMGRIAKVALNADNPIAVKSHTRTEPIVLAENDPWKRTMQRSLKVRSMLQFAGVDGARFDRITGNADTEHVVDDALSVRNNRVEIVFLIGED